VVKLDSLAALREGGKREISEEGAGIYRGATERPLRFCGMREKVGEVGDVRGGNGQTLKTMLTGGSTYR
jgi:hypothetical protein